MENDRELKGHIEEIDKEIEYLKKLNIERTVPTRPKAKCSNLKQVQCEITSLERQRKQLMEAYLLLKGNNPDRVLNDEENNIIFDIYNPLAKEKAFYLRYDELIYNINNKSRLCFSVVTALVSLLTFIALLNSSLLLAPIISLFSGLLTYAVAKTSFKGILKIFCKQKQKHYRKMTRMLDSDDLIISLKEEISKVYSKLNDKRASRSEMLSELSLPLDYDIVKETKDQKQRSLRIRLLQKEKKALEDNTNPTDDSPRIELVIPNTKDKTLSLTKIAC